MTSNYRNLCNKDYYEECVICAESYYNNNDDSKSLIVTICGHHFHYGCLTQWCNINNSCPTCRTKNVCTKNDLLYNKLSVITPVSPSNNGNNDNNSNNDEYSLLFDGLISSGSTATTASNASPYILNQINFDISNVFINNNLGNYQERNNPNYFNNIYNNNNIN
jgi:hypothetical protein